MKLTLLSFKIVEFRYVEPDQKKLILVPVNNKFLLLVNEQKMRDDEKKRKDLEDKLKKYEAA